jgi:hypothetical protein
MSIRVDLAKSTKLREVVEQPPSGTMIWQGLRSWSVKIRVVGTTFRAMIPLSWVESDRVEGWHLVEDSMLSASYMRLNDLVSADSWVRVSYWSDKEA